MYSNDMYHFHHAPGLGICDKMIHKSSCLQHLQKNKKDKTI